MSCCPASKIFHPFAVIAVRIVLGGSLVWASWHKITDPADFAKILANYQLFPGKWINLLAIFVPWLEVFVGVALITGAGKRGAALIAAGLFTSFIVILGYNLARDCPTICGCFSTFAEGTSLTRDEKFAKMRSEIWLVDVPSLAAALYVAIASCSADRRAGEKSER